jgi:Tetratricopeptide repeat
VNASRTAQTHALSVGHTSWQPFGSGIHLFESTAVKTKFDNACSQACPRQGGVPMDDNQKSGLSEHVMIAIVSNLFWLVILIVCIVLFRAEIRNALNSLNSVDIAGSHIKLSDRELAIRSYTTLSNIFVDRLSDSEVYSQFTALLSVSNAQQLNKFLREYVREVPRENLNLALVKNVAHIAFRKGYIPDSIELYKAIIEKVPDSPDLLAAYGDVLLRTNPSKAKAEFDKLIKRYPGQYDFTYGRAKAAIKLDEFDAAATDLNSCFKAGYYGDGGMREWIDQLCKGKAEIGKKVLENHDKLVATIYERAIASIKTGDFKGAADDLNTCLDHRYFRNDTREYIEKLAKDTPGDGKELLQKHDKLVALMPKRTEAKGNK